jgi:hypothetical protein
MRANPIKKMRKKNLPTRKKNNIKKENNNVSKRKVVRTLKWVEKRILCKKVSRGVNQKK